MSTEADTSDAAAVERLMSILPDEGYNMTAADPVEEPKEEPKPAEEVKPEPEAKADPTEPNKEAEAQATEPTEVEIEYEGSRYKLPAELKDAFLRQQDYTKKTMELAEQRKALESNKAVPEELQQVKQQLTHYETLLGQQVLADQQVDWVKMLREDPIGYLEQKELAEARKAEWNRISVQKQEESRKEMGQKLEQEAQQLVAKQPEWKDLAKFNADKEKIFTSLEKIGYTRQEFDSVTDHRALLIADKARKYDELMASKAEVTKKIEKLPPKVERPGVVTSSEGQASKAAMQTLRKTGSVDDAAAALLSLMN